MIFLLDAVSKNDSLVSERDLASYLSTTSFIAVFTMIYFLLGEAAWPAEPTLLISAKMMGALLATPVEPGSYV